MFNILESNVSSGLIRKYDFGARKHDSLNNTHDRLKNNRVIVGAKPYI